MPSSNRPADILRLMALCGEHFAGPSWSPWRAVLKGLFGLPMSTAELDTFKALSGRSEAPSSPARELWAVCGRRGGKSIVAALVAVYLSTCRTYRLAPGERAVFPVIAADRRQSRVIRRYVGGLLSSTPVLSQLIERETKDAIDLTTGISIEIHTASYRTIRGYTCIGAACDEIAFWPVDDAAEPDREILAALRPAMATVPGAVLLCLSNPYARRGELYRAHRDHYGKDGDDVLVIQADTRSLNATVPESIIQRAYADDAASASAEYGAEFRSDVESYITLEVLESVTVPGRRELPPIQGRVQYFGFVDFAGGSGADSATLAIAHAEKMGGHRIAVLDLIREVRPPFSPEQVCAQFSKLLRRYGLGSATADRYAGGFPVEAMRKHGIRLRPSKLSKSEIYTDTLPLLNSSTVELLDHERLRAQLVGLERRTARGGRDSIDHGPSGHDDVANAVAGALVLAASKRERRPLDVSARPKAERKGRVVIADVADSAKTMAQIRRERAKFARLFRTGRGSWTLPAGLSGSPFDDASPSQPRYDDDPLRDRYK